MIPQSISSFVLRRPAHRCLVQAIISSSLSSSESTTIKRSYSVIVSNNNHPVSSASSLVVPLATQQQQQQQSNSQHQHQQQYLQYRTFGTRGARGHGWYVNYRASNKGGRHLQGEYYDREDIEQRIQWNQSILQLGSTTLYLDVVTEPTSTNMENFLLPNSKKYDVTKLRGETTRLYLDIATTVLPETTTNFIELCKNEYKGTKFYRIEKNVGICGGDILTNTGRTGRAGQPHSNDIKNPAVLLDIHTDPLVLWHIPGTISMLVPKVNSIDSRFMICTETANHMDGIHRAFGQFQPSSFEQLQKWSLSLLTMKGIPTSFDLIISDCGIVDEKQQQQPPPSSETSENDTTTTAAA